ncbi:hypothetical protein NM688_g3387 [Phlebia brevispora]|uniref:Uncharacterized protein n=1 Tax=Phlebia brevispora TaxID=194682 RepID=A0ACC1T5U4_9APHY|nr:hypothetical protein NM688_g3387 [Phlebia brevispora]
MAPVKLLLSKAISKLRNVSRNLKQPPGPPGQWWFGNAYQIPPDKQWLKFDEWTRTYGDIVQISVTGQPVVILGSIQAVNDLLDARGSIYSDRPPAVMAGELVGWNRGFGYSRGPHDPRFREFRRLFNKFIGPRRMQDPGLFLTQERYASKLLVRLLNEPQAFITHIRQSIGALLLHVAYGYDVPLDRKEDPFVRIVEVAMQGFSRVSEPGAFLVDTLPWLKYVPAWFPGANFKRLARRMWQEREELYNIPFEFVKTQMKRNQAAPSFIRSYLEEKVDPNSDDEEIIKVAAASLYSGGIDSTPSSLCSFILAMTLHPEIQTRAQAEIDSVIGKGWQRLPTFADRERLPYVNAIVLELLRWHPAVPLGLAHMLAEPDVYREYYLQKGTVVWANIWTILHDETIYPDPFEFRPERYLSEEGTLRTLERTEDPAVISFGFGRRYEALSSLNLKSFPSRNLISICPGLFLALNSIFINVCMMLYVFDIKMITDERGEEVIPEVEYKGLYEVCPYAQRVEIALAEAGAEFTRYEIDLKNKPEWYLPKVNPVGKVPAIAYGGPKVPADQPSPESVKLNESLVLVEFVADLFPESGILPKDPVLPNFAVVSEGGDPEQLVKALVQIQDLLPPEGFAIGEYSAADIAITPFLARLKLSLENDLGGYPAGKGEGTEDLAASPPA